MTQYGVLAFPNAYLEVDELPRRFPWARALALLGLVAISLFSLTVVVLHFEPTGYDPAFSAVSDYAVGAYSFQMDLGFFAGGSGLASLGVASYMIGTRPRARLGACLLVLSGVALFSVGLFPTDLEGAPATFHGAAHVALSGVVFIASPAGMLMVSSTLSRRWFILTLGSLVAAVAIASAQVPLSMDYAGAAERAYIAVMVAWWMLASVRILRAR